MKTKLLLLAMLSGFGCSSEGQAPKQTSAPSQNHAGTSQTAPKNDSVPVPKPHKEPAQPIKFEPTIETLKKHPDRIAKEDLAHTIEFASAQEGEEATDFLVNVTFGYKIDPELQKKAFESLKNRSLVGKEEAVAGQYDWNLGKEQYDEFAVPLLCKTRSMKATDLLIQALNSLIRKPHLKTMALEAIHSGLQDESAAGFTRDGIEYKIKDLFLIRLTIPAEEGQQWRHRFMKLMLSIRTKKATEFLITQVKTRLNDHPLERVANKEILESLLQDYERLRGLSPNLRDAFRYYSDDAEMTELIRQMLQRLQTNA